MESSSDSDVDLTDEQYIKIYTRTQGQPLASGSFTSAENTCVPSTSSQSYSMSSILQPSPSTSFATRTSSSSNGNASKCMTTGNDAQQNKKQEKGEAQLQVQKGERKQIVNWLLPDTNHESHNEKTIDLKAEHNLPAPDITVTLDAIEESESPIDLSTQSGESSPVIDENDFLPNQEFIVDFLEQIQNEDAPFPADSQILDEEEQPRQKPRKMLNPRRSTVEPHDEGTTGSGTSEDTSVRSTQPGTLTPQQTMEQFWATEEAVEYAQNPGESPYSPSAPLEDLEDEDSDTSSAPPFSPVPYSGELKRD